MRESERVVYLMWTLRRRTFLGGLLALALIWHWSSDVHEARAPGAGQGPQGLLPRGLHPQGLHLQGLHGRLQAGVVLNEVLASNRRFNLSPLKRSSDWIELHNRRDIAQDVGGYRIVVAGLETSEYTLPAVSIPARGYLLVWFDGKLEMDEDAVRPKSSRSFRSTFISLGESWHYLLPGDFQRDLPDAWHSPHYVADGVRVGASGFGYGDGDDVTIVPEDTSVLFMRRTFDVFDLTSIHNLTLKMDYDDGFVAYLNGEVVAGSNAPKSDPGPRSVATAKHEAGSPELFHLDGKAKLRPGRNVLAITGLNAFPSSDMTIRPELGRLILDCIAGNSLPIEGGEIRLIEKGGNELDAITYPAQVSDQSYGRVSSGSWAYFFRPTPEAPNGGVARPGPLACIVKAQPDPGVHAEPLAVALSAEGEAGAELRYTTDGSMPDRNSQLYGEPLIVEDRAIFRVAAFMDGERISPLRSFSFFVRPSGRLPILSIAMSPEDFAVVHGRSNARGRESERAAHLEIFDPRGSLVAATGCGLRLHGGAGRNGGMGVKKSYRTYFRKLYGVSRLKYSLFEDSKVSSFDKLVLRGGYNDRLRPSRGGYNTSAAYVRDQVIRDLHRQMGALAAHGAWYVLFVNMEYRGLVNVVERMDEEFLNAYLGESEWDVMKTGEESLVGDSNAWQALKAQIFRSNSSPDDTIELLEEYVDLEAFASYMILNIWAQNEDWPHNNWYAYRERVANGKWRFLCWDTEWGLGLRPSGYRSDTFSAVFSRGGVIRDLFVALLRSENFCSIFHRLAEEYLNSVLRPDHVIAQIREQVSRVDSEIPRELEAFASPMNRELWVRNVGKMEEFARGRGAYFRTLIQARVPRG